MKKIISFALLLALLVYSPARAATGCTYPASLDSFVDKLAGDFLTIADINTRSCAIEKLESGPLRPNDGTVSLPAYAFRSASSSGMYYTSATPKIGFAIGGTAVFDIVKTTSAVNYIQFTAAATAGAPSILGTGSDTNVGLILNTKGTGSLVFDVGGSIKASIDNSGRILVGHLVTTSTSGGDVVLQNLSGIRSLTAAGTDTAAVVRLNSSNQVEIGGTNAADIKWQIGLISNGGGATPTFGSIGGSGPATAAQNSWMRVIDNGGNAFWVPAWK